MAELSHHVTVPSNSASFWSGHGVQRSRTANVNNSPGPGSFLYDLGTITLHFVGPCIAFSLVVILIFYSFSFRKSASVVWLHMRRLSLCGSGDLGQLVLMPPSISLFPKILSPPLTMWRRNYQDKEYFNDAVRWDPSTFLFYSLVLQP